MLEGVPGELVDIAPADILFGERRLKTSPYDPLLLQLKNAGAGKFLKFGDLRCRPSLTVRAKKLGLKILFGEQGQTLWVTLAKADLDAVGGPIEPQPARPAMTDLVLKALGAKRNTAGEIVSWMRSNGATGIGITQVDGLLSNLARAGKIKLRRSGDDGPEKWALV
jgi:hypothetical protein